MDTPTEAVMEVLLAVMAEVEHHMVVEVVDLVELAVIRCQILVLASRLNTGVSSIVKHIFTIHAN